MESNLTIGALARKVGVATETLRYYERLGLLEPNRRTVSNYRLYDANALQRLRFIRRAQILGFSLTEISELLSLHGQVDADMEEVSRLARQKIKNIENKIDDLTRMKAGLETLVDRCPGHGPTSECPILSALFCEDH